MFVLKIVWRKSIASLHRLTQAVQRANLQRTAGDPTWVFTKVCFCMMNSSEFFQTLSTSVRKISSKSLWKANFFVHYNSSNPIINLAGLVLKSLHYYTSICSIFSSSNQGTFHKTYQPAIVYKYIPCFDKFQIVYNTGL